MAVRYEREGRIAVITIDRPEALNALDLDHWRTFGEATQRFEDDAEAWVGIVTGAGERAFCAGADIKSTINRLMDDPRNNPYDEPATIMRGQYVSKPLVAAVNGVALGGGLEVALACDLRVAAQNARFGAPEVNLGLIPGWGGTQRLVRQLPWAVAARIVFTGEMIGAEEALRVGLVNAVVDQADLMAEARRWAELVASRGPVAVRAAKRAMVEGGQMQLDEGLALEHQLFSDLAYTEDVREGIAAFEEKRAANFQGR